MPKTVDARGLSCPQPVILTLNAIQEGEDQQIIVQVDTETSRENVERAAVSQSCTIVDVSPEGDGYRITMQKST